MEAFRLSRSHARYNWWWNWWPSWIVAGGPIGRYAGGVILAWKEMDRVRGGGLYRLSTGILIAIGLMLSMITIVSVLSVITCSRVPAHKAEGLAYTTITLVLRGHLTIDRERQRSHTRARHAIEKLRAASQPIPPKLEEALLRFTDIHHFYVPILDSSNGSHDTPSVPTEGVSWLHFRARALTILVRRETGSS